MSNHIYQFKITIRQQLALLAPMLILWTFASIFIIFIMHQSLIGGAAIFVFCFFFPIDTLPTLILHIQYWLKNHGAVFTLDTESHELTYEKSGKIWHYSFSDIDSFVYYRNLGKGGYWNSFSWYRYYKITLKDNTKIYITCLMVNDIENTLPLLMRMKNSGWHARWLNVIT